jgi:lipid-binding SYLF domain-containing protein
VAAILLVVSGRVAAVPISLIPPSLLPGEEGALIQGDKVIAYYNTAGASFGLQAGAQTYGYAIFFMNDGAVRQLDSADGFEVGIGPSVVVVDQGMAKSTTTTMKDDIYALIFGQKGLMAGLGVQGNKITKIDPK